MTTVDKACVNGILLYIVRCPGLTHLEARAFMDWFRMARPHAVAILFA
jgi:hypothetical protein